MIENIVIEISELSAEEESSVVLTRYLYNKNEVIVSLKMAMFDKNIEEAMFWGYELYFSGFEYDVFKVLSDMYELYYHAKHPNLGNYLNKMILKWEDEQNVNDNHWILGTIIKNMALRSISLTYMLEERQGLSHLPSQIQEKTQNIFIQVKDDEIKQYYTINSLEFGRTYKFLRNVCKYTIRREAMDIFGTYYQDFKPTKNSNGTKSHLNPSGSLTSEDLKWDILNQKEVQGEALNLFGSMTKKVEIENFNLLRLNLHRFKVITFNP